MSIFVNFFIVFIEFYYIHILKSYFFFVYLPYFRYDMSNALTHSFFSFYLFATKFANSKLLLLLLLSNELSILKSIVCHHRVFPIDFNNIRHFLSSFLFLQFFFLNLLFSPSFSLSFSSHLDLDLNGESMCLPKPCCFKNIHNDDWQLFLVKYNK